MATKKNSDPIRPTFGGHVRQTITTMATRIVKVHSCQMRWQVRQDGDLVGLLYPSLSLILGIRSGDECGSQIWTQMFPPKREGKSLETHKDRVNAFLSAMGDGEFLNKKNFPQLLDIIDNNEVQARYAGKEFQATITPWFAPCRIDGELMYEDQHPDYTTQEDETWIPWIEEDPVTGNKIQTHVLGRWATNPKGVKLYTLIDAQRS